VFSAVPPQEEAINWDKREEETGVPKVMTWPGQTSSYVPGAVLSIG
jgi:hypothetical protein